MSTFFRRRRLKIFSVADFPDYSWLALAVSFLGEFLLFDARTSTRWAWIFPRWNDQIQYLTESYTGYEFLRHHGWLAGLWQTLVNPSAQGTLHDFYAVVIFALAGPSRSAALAVNLLALIAWQLSLFWVVRRELKAHSLAWVAAALPLALRYPWSVQPGSALDFRLDHLAMCTLGVCLSCALATKGFRLVRPSVLFGFLVGLMLLTRFLSGAYFIVIFFAAFLFALSHRDRRARVLNLLLAAVVGAATAGPVFWINREWIYNYYVIGHFIGPESAIRNPHMGLIRSIDFIFSHLWREQLGIYWLSLIALATASVAALTWSRRREFHSTPPHDRSWIFLGCLFFAAPALVLTLHQQKSEVVLGVMVPGLLVLVVVLWARWLPEFPATKLRWSFATAIVVGSSAYFARQQFASVGDHTFRADARLVNRLADDIYRTSEAAHLAHPRVAVDQVTDYFDGQVMRVICYERHRKWIPFIMTLPTGIAEDQEAVLMDRLAHSDFVFITEAGPVGGWPYDRQMQVLLPKTQAWCEEHLIRKERFDLFGRSMVLYQRPDLP